MAPRSFTIIASFAACVAGGACAGTPERLGGERYPWVADQGDGTYRNPVLFGDYSDPDVIRVGDDYYLVSSSFTSTPGLPILKSHDLVTWTIVGHAIEQVPLARYARVQPGAGMWAPALREHAGTFYLFAPTPDEGIYVLTAPHPEGPWSAPRLLLAGKGLIDPCPFWDDDGRAYLIHAYARSRAGIKHKLRIRPMAADASRVLGEGAIVFDDPARHPTLEGPKLTKRNGWYYILAPAGGVPLGWQVALRSRAIMGPYEDRVVLQQGRTPVNGPHQGALVDTPDGQWWFIHFQEIAPYGRVVHLNPVTWQDGWPLMGVAAPGSGVRQPVLRFAKPHVTDTPASKSIAAIASTSPQTSDELDGPRLGLQWQWSANHDDAWWSLAARPGWLRLVALMIPNGDLGQAPNLLLQKLPARAFAVETDVELAVDGPGGGSSGDGSGEPNDGGGGSARAGVVVLGQTHAALVIAARPGGRRAVELRIDNHTVVAREVPAATTRLRVTMANGGLCRFAYQAQGASMQDLPATFQARPGVWVGARVGLFAARDRDDPSVTAHADFAAFRFLPPPPP